MTPHFFQRLCWAHQIVTRTVYRCKIILFLDPMKHAKIPGPFVSERWELENIGFLGFLGFHQRWPSI